MTEPPGPPPPVPPRPPLPTGWAAHAPTPLPAPADAVPTQVYPPWPQPAATPTHQYPGWAQADAAPTAPYPGWAQADATPTQQYPGWSQAGAVAAPQHHPSAPAPSPGFAPPWTAAAPAGWQPPRTRRPGAATGVVALVLAALAAIVTPIIGGVAAFAIGEGVAASATPATLDESSMAELRFLSPVRDIVLVAEIAFWSGTVLGILAIVLGILAITRRRGRGFGIASVIVAPIGFVLFVIVVWIAVIAGLATGAAAVFAP